MANHSFYESAAQGTIGTAAKVVWGTLLTEGTLQTDDQYRRPGDIGGVVEKIFWIENLATTGTETVTGTIFHSSGYRGSGFWQQHVVGGTVGSSAAGFNVVSGTVSKNWEVRLNAVAGTVPYRVVVQGVWPGGA